jgi:AcrR family transcriptional regulator
MENQIFISGKKLFYKNGYFNTKISDITNDIGISTGNFYTYYSSKEALLDKVLRKELKVLKRGYEVSINIDGNLEDVLNNFFMLTLTFAKNMTPLYKLRREVDGKLYRFKETTIELVKEYNGLLSYYISEILIRDSLVVNNLEIIVKLISIQIHTYLLHLVESGEIEFFHINKIKKNSTIMTSLSISVCNIFNLTFEKDDKFDQLTGVYSEKFFMNYLENTISNNEINDFLFFVVFPRKLVTDKESFFAKSILTGMTTILKEHIKSDDVIGIVEGIYFVIYMNHIHNQKIIDSIRERFKTLFKDLEKKYSAKGNGHVEIVPILVEKNSTYDDLKNKIFKVIENSKNEHDVLSK